MGRKAGEPSTIPTHNSIVLSRVSIIMSIGKAYVSVPAEVVVNECSYEEYTLSYISIQARLISD